MRGHIKKRGSTYSIIVDIGKDPTSGKRRQKWFSGYKTKKEAQTALAKIIYEIEQNTFILPSTETLKEFLTYWLEQRKSKLSPSSYSGYNVIINNHIIPAIGHVKLKELKPLIINEYYNNKLESLSARTVLHHHRMLRKALEDAKNWQLLTMNPADNVETPKAKKYKADVLDPEEINVLLQALKGDRLEIPITVMLFLGLRRGELLGLKWSDIDEDNKTVTIQWNLIRGGEKGTEVILKDTKTDGSNRTIPLSNAVMDLLEKQKLYQKTSKLKMGTAYKKTDFVFTIEDGSPWNPATFSHAFGDFIRKHNLKRIRLHDLRHTNATLMLLNNTPAKVASERLGHSTVSTTLDIYSHVLKNMETETSEKISDIIFNTK